MMNEIIGRNIYLFRDQKHLSLIDLSNQILEEQQIYISPIELKDYESGISIEAESLFFIALALRVNVSELYEANPLLN